MIRLTLALVLAFAVPGIGAPVPLPPKELTVELLVGTWDKEYGDGKGEITFAANGTYNSVYRSGEFNLDFSGTWKLEAGQIVLDWNEEPWMWTLGTKDWPRLVGNSNRGVRVGLYNRRR